ncbi:MAG: type II toxin-antitoxin system RelE family toxin [Streptosporangiaceae bacterium]
MRVDWSPEAITMASRFMEDRAGLTAVMDATDALAGDPYPAGAFHRGGYHRLRVGPYRVVYLVEGDLITVDRVDRVAG